MKKVLSIAFINAALFASAQISFAGKANLIFPTGSPSWKNIKGTVNTAVEGEGKNNAGFNVGLSMKVGIPMAFYVMPELYYTHFKNEFTASNTTFDIQSNRVDLPVLLGYNLLGNTLSAFVGPVASYNLSKEDTFNDFRENARDNFTVGYQFGAQVELKSLIINAKYEGSFSKDSRDFINRVSGEEIRYDNRPNLFMVGLGYKF
ncbi:MULTISPECIES: outer membrane beta-barrel protein [Chryseobacterium]|uniref:Opacity protein-like surface antigen n=1 Tax=Chryseobacterium camelliae TaxID=1265445 RepID=A0ABU0TLU1_9FLAO|nr:MULTISPECIES: outer membrane beta-barrel protein [Chryseobacterium]MDT3408121.1 opacity protein-like surface antigen [Pseudacidovorax intermedius]MDQ1098023.1 opacity protein-like surface antigen [Chryseobacterium camelliae]MDQ1101951.1 opacity protein-like surface antigen [Chryseobacterium sp. SORGH_AS_1048]MDR6085391.1 opacity protein-like surface antigen [Chryseobacterium sp. SORGH_AS_0909]MDR6129753.1 opacity protein-like surface antigen [Chryseobacterium sp. SORGH_AS_1175]